MDKKYNVDREILFYAFRYSLGRQTFAPTTAMDNIKCNIKDISTGDIKAYIREIKEQEVYGYGMECDKRDWLNFMKYLESELLTRSTI
jgi:hypothetical protein